MAQVSTIGLDLAKNVFQVHGIDAQGKWDWDWDCPGLDTAGERVEAG